MADDPFAPTVARIAEQWDVHIPTATAHSESCWQWHPRCTIHWLIGRIDALEEQLRDLAVETDRLRGQQ